MHVFEEYVGNIGNPELKQPHARHFTMDIRHIPSIRAKNCLESAHVHGPWHIYYWV